MEEEKTSLSDDDYEILRAVEDWRRRTTSVNQGTQLGLSIEEIADLAKVSLTVASRRVPTLQGEGYLEKREVKSEELLTEFGLTAEQFSFLSKMRQGQGAGPGETLESAIETMTEGWFDEDKTLTPDAIALIDQITALEDKKAAREAMLQKFAEFETELKPLHEDILKLLAHGPLTTHGVARVLGSAPNDETRERARERVLQKLTIIGGAPPKEFTDALEKLRGYGLIRVYKAKARPTTRAAQQMRQEPWVAGQGWMELREPIEETNLAMVRRVGRKAGNLRYTISTDGSDSLAKMTAKNRLIIRIPQILRPSPPGWVTDRRPTRRGASRSTRQSRQTR